MPEKPASHVASTTFVVGIFALIVLLLVGCTASGSTPAAHFAVKTHSAAATPTPAPTPADEAEPLDPKTVVEPSESPSGTVKDSTVTDTTALALLAKLPIKPEVSKANYKREADFGAAWLDMNHNGCDTRNDILARDLTDITKSGSCRVLTGVLKDPYTATTIHFVRGVGTSIKVQIDHVVALADAWVTGAQQLTLGQRESLANDPLNLLAVDGRSNEQKQADDASEWLPANHADWCPYVARQVSVKVTYRLWVTQAEHDAMRSVLSACPTQKGSSSAFAPTSNPVAKKEPLPAKPALKPAPKPVPKPVLPGGGATALCKDGSFSYAAHHQGACSRHGGVSVFYK